MKTPFKIKFLDMKIQDTGNGDGVTLIGVDSGMNDCSVGNFSDLPTAKIWAVRWLMIQHPVVFGHQVWQRMNESANGCSHEWFKFKRFCELNKIEIPAEISHSTDGNFSITCGGFHV